VDKLCPRCQCKHEERSTITIKVVVILILWILAMLVLYLVFLVCIEPFVTSRPRVQVRRGTNLPYQTQRNESSGGGDGDGESINNDVNINATPLRDYRCIRQDFLNFVTFASVTDPDPWVLNEN
jgi:hypothetical protein